MTLRWSTERESDCRAATSFESCGGPVVATTEVHWKPLLLDRILMLAWVSIRVTSRSSIAVFTELVEPFLFSWLGSYEWRKNCDRDRWGFSGSQFESWLVEDVTVWLSLSFWSFWTSRDSNWCSSSLIKSMAPPTIEAWSPFHGKERHKEKKEHISK